MVRVDRYENPAGIDRLDKYVTLQREFALIRGARTSRRDNTHDNHEHWQNLRPSTDHHRYSQICELIHKHYFSGDIAPLGMKAPLTLRQLHPEGGTLA